MAWNNIDIEYEIEKMFTCALRAIFAFDDKFIYNEDDIQTQIAITTDYPDTNNTLTKPHIVITNISYDYNVNTFIGRNFAEPAYNDDGVYIGDKFANIVPYSVTLDCLAQFYESKDLGNKVLNFITFSARDVFENIGAHVVRVTKGVTTPKTQYPEKIFQTPIAISGELHITGIRTNDINLSDVLQKIQDGYQTYLK